MKIKNLKVKIQKLKLKFKTFNLPALLCKTLQAGLLLVFLTFAFLLLTLSAAHAQETQRTITIIPPNIQKTLNPGDKAEGIMKVINDSDIPLTFDASTRDYIVIDTAGTPNFLPPNTLNKDFSAAAWIGIVPNNFTVPPHEKQLLNYYIQVPLDARPGGHYAGAVYTPKTTGDLKSSGASVQTQLGTLFYISINGPIRELSMITKLFAKPFQEYGPVDIATQIKNFGDLHIKPSGNITISDIFGRKLTALPLEKTNIFPGSARDFQNKFGGKIMFGRFKASLVAGYGKSDNLPLFATIYFWVFPWKLTLLTILIITAIVLGYMYWKKKITLKKAEKTQAT